MDDREDRLRSSLEYRRGGEGCRRLKIPKKTGLIIMIAGFAAFMILKYAVQGQRFGDVMQGISDFIGR